MTYTLRMTCPGQNLPTSEILGLDGKLKVLWNQTRTEREVYFEIMHLCNGRRDSAGNQRFR